MNRAFAVLLLGLLACNYDVGECWVPGDEPSGAGGGIINPTGAGGFGNVPREPQSIDGSWDLCSSQTVECTVTWKADSSACREQGAASSCTTVYQGQHASLEEAEEQCEKINGVGAGSGAQSCGSCGWGTSSASSSCRRKCEERAEACEAECRKLPEDDKVSRRKCWDACNNAYAECIKKCKG
ncbi:hypothetical protein WMF04_37720 [Sorangium sp. So ce260]|uniref:hypothetical protein n=1 Tax=Sorangium sp. So ce260 TaxID=3133291 RepID=UPI003F64082B